MNDFDETEKWKVSQKTLNSILLNVYTHFKTTTVLLSVIKMITRD